MKNVVAVLRARPKLLIALETLGIYVAVWLYFHWRQFQTPNMPGTDGYYHIKLAWVFLTEGIPDNHFRWAQFSMWKDSFYDKEFGFHILLMPFAGGDLMTGAKLGAVTYGAAVFASFHAALRLSGVRHTWFWTLTFIGSGAYFGYRVLVPRPQIVSMSLAIWAAYFVLQRNWKGTGVIAALYALCYTAPLIVVIYALIAMILWGVLEGKWDWKVPLAAVVGILVGWFIHPHFPNNFRLTWIQLVDVLSNAWGVSGPNLSLGGEFRPADSRSLLREHVPLYVGFMMAMLMMTRVRRLGPRFLTVFALANAWFIMTCMTKRFVEYWVPLTIWLLAIVFEQWWESIQADPPELWTRPWARRSAVAALVVFVAITQVYSHLSILKEFRGPGPGVLDKAARWLDENSPSDAQVYTCDWDDAPELFFHNHDNRYMVFLDPNFMYKWDRDVWQTWHDVANGKSSKPVDTIINDFNAHYGVCTNNFGALKRQLIRDPRAQVQTVGGGFVFEINDAADANESGSPANPLPSVPFRELRPIRP